MCFLPTCEKEQEEGAKRCSRCHAAHYCNDICQSADWARHKHECWLFLTHANLIERTCASASCDKRLANDEVVECPLCRDVFFCSVACLQACAPEHVQTNCGGDVKREFRDNVRLWVHSKATFPDAPAQGDVTLGERLLGLCAGASMSGHGVLYIGMCSASANVDFYKGQLAGDDDVKSEEKGDDEVALQSMIKLLEGDAERAPNRLRVMGVAALTGPPDSLVDEFACMIREMKAWGTRGVLVVFYIGESPNLQVTLRLHLDATKAPPRAVCHLHYAEPASLAYAISWLNGYAADTRMFDTLSFDDDAVAAAAVEESQSTPAPLEQC
jgi:hypothetical protein